jgi:rhamnosyltransferase
MQKEKIVIATILYKPGIEVWLRIKLALENGYRVYIFDNSPNTTHCPVNISSSPNLRYFTLGSNVGIGTALRQICATAYFEHNEYLLYFDQDTVFSSDTVAYISSFCAVVEDRGTFSDDRLARLSSVTFRDRKSTSCRAKIDVSGYSLQIVDFTINSGALFF